MMEFLAVSKMKSKVEVILKKNESLSLTKTGLAEALGIKPNLFYRILSGDRPEPYWLEGVLNDIVEDRLIVQLVNTEQKHTGAPKRSFVIGLR